MGGVVLCWVLCLFGEKGGIQKGTSNPVFRQFNSVFFSIGLKKFRVRFYLFVFVLVGGRLIRVSRSDWVGVWVGLEVNIFGVVPFFCGMGLVKEMEAVVKYFVVQSIGSIFLLLGGVSRCLGLGGFFLYSETVKGVWLLSLVRGFLLKLGLAPFHFWVPNVMVGLS